MLCGVLQAAHLSCKVLYHLIMQHAYLRFTFCCIGALNIQVAETERLFLRHTALDAVACQHGNGDDQVIFQIAQRIFTQLAVTLSTQRRVQQMHRVAVPGNDTFKKGKFRSQHSVWDLLFPLCRQKMGEILFSGLVLYRCVKL